ncbi:(+)-neomenthol dehydrogenase-like [Diospyros lotus]|uniref:(+)-neomenthol dehydrogenase-like n=1 Tax=Diospyros lotus TaxID=55363 RepID=UPI00224F4659|nr:(+)-neomenthol dehydrogenase-like [Diospyros lotus]
MICCLRQEVWEFLSNAETLTEDRVDEVLNVFMKDFKEGLLEAKSWPTYLSAAYALSKASLNAYTRVLAKKHPDLMINCVNPGYVKTNGIGVLTVEEGAQSLVRLGLRPGGGPSGLYFFRMEASDF